MELSIFIAQSLSVLYLSVALGMLISQDYYKKFYERFFEEMTAMYIGGFIALLIGFFMIKFHHRWVADWTVMITIIGWLAFLKGIIILISPNTFQKAGKVVGQKMEFFAPVVLILGMVFGYFGFIAHAG